MNRPDPTGVPETNGAGLSPVPAQAGTGRQGLLKILAACGSDVIVVLAILLVALRLVRMGTFFFAPQNIVGLSFQIVLLAVARKLLAAREKSVLVVLIVLLIALSFSSAQTTFFTPQNYQNLFLQIALLGIFAIGETIVIITGGIDLSLGSLIAFSGMVLAWTATRLNASMYVAIAVALAILVALGVSFAIGGVHATLVHQLRLPAFVVTLASLTILHSQSLLINRQLPIPITEFPFLHNLTNGVVFANSRMPLPIPFIMLIVIAVVMHLILSKARIGRYVYSLGSNPYATRLSGVNVGRVQLFAYGMSALLGGLVGILYAGYGGQGDPLIGGGYELNAVAAAVIGGANLMGGQGSVPGTILGACLLNVILTAINLTISNPALWQGTVVGGVLLFAVLVTALQQRRHRVS